MLLFYIKYIKIHFMQSEKYMPTSIVRIWSKKMDGKFAFDALKSFLNPIYQLKQQKCKIP